MYDPSGRSIDYLRVSVTDRCNLRCAYCMPAEGVRLLSHRDILSYEEIAAVVEAAVGLGLRKVRLTGGEPLVRPQLERLVALLRAIPELGVLAMTTNGTLLAPRAEALRRAGLDSVNISLDTLDPARYAAITRGGRLADALAGIDAAQAAGLPVKLNVVALADTPPGDAAALAAFAADRGLALQRIRPYRLDEAKHDGPPLRPGAAGAVPLYDRPPPCALCNRIRLLADGTLRPCLHSDSGIRVDPADPRPALLACINAKPAAGGACAAHALNAIGG